LRARRRSRSTPIVKAGVGGSVTPICSATLRKSPPAARSHRTPTDAVRSASTGSKSRCSSQPLVAYGFTQVKEAAALTSPVPL
jgi:hypothetical protein